MLRTKLTNVAIRSRTLFLVACAAVAAACSSEQTVQPWISGPEAEPSVLSSVTISPEAPELDPGMSTQLTVVARNQRGEPMDLVPIVTYYSKDTNIAAVSENGRVTGVAPGWAEIEANVTIGSYRRTTSTFVYVLDPAHPDEVVLTLGRTGWLPEVAEVRTGGVVRWKSADNQKIYIMDMNAAVLDSVNLTRGSVTRRFSTSGSFRFCSGSCWDPPEWGVINVHQVTGGSE